ncbi:hypothetical protein HWI79_952 [Cryptosporidium felis]|nr:hypothetical protein HWI79_952 [Cryptosporidium felis]
MYFEEFKILEEVFKSTEKRQIWSIYSLCNHSSRLGSFEECKESLLSFIEYLSTENKSLRDEIELVYLVLGDVSSEVVSNKLVFESDISGNEKKTPNLSLYGVLKHERNCVLQQDVNNIGYLNSDQFKVECEDIYKSVKAAALLPDKVWTSKFSGIRNESSMRIRVDSAVANSEKKELVDEKCMTEPYPTKILTTCSTENEVKLEKEVDSIAEQICINKYNNTDPYPNKKNYVTELELNSESFENIQSSRKPGVIDLFEDDEDEEVDESDVKMRDAEYVDEHRNEDSEITQGSKAGATGKVKPTKRRKMSKHTEAGNSEMDKVSDFDPSEVEPIIQTKVKKEKMYKDEKSGYLVIEDEFDFIIEKENTSVPRDKTMGKKENISTKKTSKTKKAQGTTSTSKQQTLTSFFKVTKSGN